MSSGASSKLCPRHPARKVASATRGTETPAVRGAGVWALGVALTLTPSVHLLQAMGSGPALPTFPILATLLPSPTSLPCRPCLPGPSDLPSLTQPDPACRTMLQTCVAFTSLARFCTRLSFVSSTHAFVAILRRPEWSMSWSIFVELRRSPFEGDDSGTVYALNDSVRKVGTCEAPAAEKQHFDVNGFDCGARSSETCRRTTFLG